MAKVDFGRVVIEFIQGIQREAEASEITTPDSSEVTRYLTALYKELHEERDPSEIILDCAHVMGQITFAMYRSERPKTEGNFHIGRDPETKVVQPSNALEPRHLDRARRMYYGYMNGRLRRQLRNPLVAPIPERYDREIDKPCPLCP
jgi:hypothetical protein